MLGASRSAALTRSQNDGARVFNQALRATAAPRTGEMVSHCGLLRHAGQPVTAGTRYILAGFVRARPLAAEWRGVRRHVRERLAAREEAEAESEEARGRGAGDANLLS